MRYGNDVWIGDINSIDCPCCGNRISFHMNEALYSATTTVSSDIGDSL